jgi:hypothetical protein
VRLVRGCSLLIIRLNGRTNNSSLGDDPGRH